MIFVTDARSTLAYVGPEWADLTGQPLSEAVGWGWLACLHAADREIIRTFLQGAVREHAEFHGRYRMRTPDGGHVWVAAGAVPSFGPTERTFLGYLGSVTRIGPSARRLWPPMGRADDMYHRRGTAERRLSRSSNSRPITCSWPTA